MRLALRLRRSSLVKLDSADTSEMLLPLRYSHVRLVRPDKDERSDISLLFIQPSPNTHSSPRSKSSRPVANSSPVKSLMFEFGAERLAVKLAISSRVIGAPLALPSAVSIAARRFASGMVTVVPFPPPLPPPGVDTSLPKLLPKIRKSPKPIAPSLSKSYFASYLPSP